MGLQIPEILPVTEKESANNLVSWITDQTPVDTLQYWMNQLLNKLNDKTVIFTAINLYKIKTLPNFNQDHIVLAASYDAKDLTGILDIANSDTYQGCSARELNYQTNQGLLRVIVLIRN